MTGLRLTIFALAIAGPSSAQDAAMISAAKRTLEIAQVPSFETGVEHCGLLGQITGARYVATKPRSGRVNSCKPKGFSGNVEVIASYHTHGSFDPDAYAEVPSTSDVRADMEEGVFGFVSTPGGRLWMIDPVTGLSTMLCDLGCLPQDPAFEDLLGDELRAQNTLEQLQRREDGE